MRFLRGLCCLYFLGLAITCVGVPFRDLLAGGIVQYSLQPLTLFQAVFRDLVLCGLTSVFVMAAWICWRERRSEKVHGGGWVILACLLNILIFFGLPILYYYLEGPSGFWAVERLFAVPQMLGFAGVMAVLPHEGQSSRRGH